MNPIRTPRSPSRLNPSHTVSRRPQLRSEVAQSLRLPLDASPAACAAARNAFTAKRISDDFYAGLDELHRLAAPRRAAADHADGAAMLGEQNLRERFKLPVFCVSAVEYQKLAGLRPADDPAQVRLPSPLGGSFAHMPAVSRQSADPPTRVVRTTPISLPPALAFACFPSTHDWSHTWKLKPFI